MFGVLMKSLFPEMEKEIRDDRKAARREEVQRHREWLKGRDLSWLVNYMIENGPVTEHVAMSAVMDEEYHLKDASKRGMDVLCGLYSLWMVRKLWRRPIGIHPGSGEETYEYGVRGVHLRNTKQTSAYESLAPKRTSDASTSTASEVESSAKIAKANEAS